MTTKPKARRFRIRRAGTPLDAAPAASGDRGGNSSDAAAAAIDAQRESAPPEPTSNATAKSDARQKAKAKDMSAEADEIRREGLTGRQLRMARRVAHKNGLSPASDIDAVRLLRLKGIDPFARSNMLELVVPNPGEDGAAQKINLPQTVPDGDDSLPALQLSPAARREREISEIQRDIVRRRRRKLMSLLGRLVAFVGLPTALAGYYFYAVATPMYSTKSEFLILQADSQGGGSGGVGGLLSGTQFATSQDSIAVQSYLLSKDAMLRLDRDVGFKSHFANPAIDPIQRLTDNPTNEEAHAVYQKRVKVGYDPTEGVIRMEVIAADPQVSADYNQALIDYSEERVNALSAQKRDDQMAEAIASFEKAEAERRDAQEALVTLQIKGATLDPEALIASIRSQINTIELQVIEKELQLAALLDNARPNQSRVDGATGDIRRLNAQLDELNARMTDVSQGENSLAQLSVGIQMAQADLLTRDMLLQSALQHMEQTRLDANRQVRYLTTSVRPVAPQEASYPRAFENTVLAFLICAGVYLMISLTASILREQVTS
ncbi:MAG: capsule biosynthesis protein [Roseobacter sp.]